MKGSIQSASVSRDQGRIHDAIALFREVITLGEAAAGSDPTVRRFVFEAHLRLSDLMISEKMFAEAEPHCHSALDLAMQESARDESNEDWQRHLGFAYRSAGRLALAQGRVEEANLLAESLVPLRRRLADAHPENDKLQLELSLALTLLAKCSSKNGDHARAWELHSESHHILSNLATCDPDNEDFAVELAFSRHHLAVWHMRQQTPEHDAQAEGLLHSVEQLVANDVGKNRAWEMQQLREATQTNLMKLARRRTGGDVPSQSASLE
jgi:tetratricopeptide (TPR) repeat protein